jgi:AcrR family transcriptional regulator
MNTASLDDNLLIQPAYMLDSGVDRLVAAAARQVATRGLAAASSRSVAQEAGVAASAISYKFGSIERLFFSVFEHGARWGQPWMDQCFEEISALPKGPAGAALALEHVIAGWTLENRWLALLYQEGLAAMPGAGPVAAWTRAWRDFWVKVAVTLGLSETDGRLMHLFFESEALYNLSTWSPALERAALREMCEHFAAVYLGGAANAWPTGALEQAERASGVLRAGSVPAAAEKIVEAAAEIVEAGGLAGLTHRAVALKAGVTTGSVTHHFRTMESLIAGTIRGQVLAMQRDPEGAPQRPSVALAPVMTAGELFDAMTDYLVTDRPWGPALRRRHLFLATLRRSDLVASAAVIRFAHGGTLRAILDELFEPPQGQRALYAGTLSRLGVASWFAASADDAPRESQAAMLAEIKARFLRNFSQT